MLDRSISGQLRRYLSIFPVVGLLGSRYAGKTTLAKSVLGESKHGGIYLNLADERDTRKLKDPLVFLEHYRDQLVVIDEIRYGPELFSTIQILIDRYKVPGRFLVLGISSPVLWGDGYNVLKGKIGLLTINPFDMSEIDNEVSIDMHFMRGGYSGSLQADTNDNSLLWLREFIRNYVERDLPVLGLKSNSQLIYSFIKMVAGCQGEIWNARAFAKALGITSPTVKKYLEYIESAFLVNVLKPFETGAGKRLVKSPKVYIYDTGLLHYLLGLNDIESLKQNDMFPISWESYVIAQVQSLVTKKVELFYYQTHQGACADLVLVKNGKPTMTLLIETSTEPVIPKGYRISIDDLKTDQNFIVSTGTSRFHLTSKVEVIGIKDLMLLIKSESI